MRVRVFDQQGVYRSFQAPDDWTQERIAAALAERGWALADEIDLGVGTPAEMSETALGDVRESVVGRRAERLPEEPEYGKEPGTKVAPDPTRGIRAESQARMDMADARGSVVPDALEDPNLWLGDAATQHERTFVPAENMIAGDMPTDILEQAGRRRTAIESAGRASVPELVSAAAGRLGLPGGWVAEDIAQAREEAPIPTAIGEVSASLPAGAAAGEVAAGTIARNAPRYASRLGRTARAAAGDVGANVTYDVSSGTGARLQEGDSLGEAVGSTLTDAYVPHDWESAQGPMALVNLGLTGLSAGSTGLRGFAPPPAGQVPGRLDPVETSYSRATRSALEAPPRQDLPEGLTQQDLRDEFYLQSREGPGAIDWYVENHPNEARRAAGLSQGRPLPPGTSTEELFELYGRDESGVTSPIQRTRQAQQFMADQVRAREAGGRRGDLERVLYHEHGPEAGVSQMSVPEMEATLQRTQEVRSGQQPIGPPQSPGPLTAAALPEGWESSYHRLGLQPEPARNPGPLTSAEAFDQDLATASRYGGEVQTGYHGPSPAEATARAEWGPVFESAGDPRGVSEIGLPHYSSEGQLSLRPIQAFAEFDAKPGMTPAFIPVRQWPYQELRSNAAPVAARGTIPSGPEAEYSPGRHGGEGLAALQRESRHPASQALQEEFSRAVEVPKPDIRALVSFSDPTPHTYSSVHALGSEYGAPAVLAGHRAAEGLGLISPEFGRTGRNISFRQNPEASVSSGSYLVDASSPQEQQGPAMSGGGANEGFEDMTPADFGGASSVQSMDQLITDFERDLSLNPNMSIEEPEQ